VFKYAICKGYICPTKVSKETQLRRVGLEMLSRRVEAPQSTGTVLHVSLYQDELMSQVKDSLDYYVKEQEEMELGKQTDEDIQTQQQHKHQIHLGSVPAKVADKTSSLDALGYAESYKFKVQKIAGQPNVK